MKKNVTIEYKLRNEEKRTTMPYIGMEWDEDFGIYFPITERMSAIYLSDIMGWEYQCVEDDYCFLKLPATAIVSMN